MRKSWVTKNSVNPVATRPAAAWADVVGLGTVSEATEYGSEDGDDRRPRRRSRGYVWFGSIGSLDDATAVVEVEWVQ